MTQTPATGSPPLMHRLAISTFEKVASKLITVGSLQLTLPDGREMFYGEDLNKETKGARVVLRVLDTNFFMRAIKDMDVGLGESYMAKEFEIDDLTSLIVLLSQNMQNFDGAASSFGILNWIGSTAQKLYHYSRSNTVEGSRKNIQEHYDLGNDMYELFLDETLSYSSGIFKTPEDSLYQSQLNKIDALIEKTQVKAGEHILEIGCGWGAFAIRAVQTKGCKVTGVTISDEQLREAQARVKAAGLEDSINIVLLDYRKLPEKFGPGHFDHAVSCEMIEAVGHENLPVYFGILDAMVRTGGRVVLQAITIKDHKYDKQLEGCDFIKRHIFPGSVLPSMQVMKELTHGSTALRMDVVEDIGLDYATTLKMWHEAWVAKEAEIKALGYSDEFFRKWRFYFSYCEGAFAVQYIHNYQIAWVKQANVPSQPVRALKASKAPASVSVRLLGAAASTVSFLTQPATLMVMGVAASVAVASSPKLQGELIKVGEDLRRAAENTRESMLAAATTVTKSI